MPMPEPFLRAPRPLPDPRPLLQLPEGCALADACLSASEAGGPLALPGGDALLTAGLPLRRVGEIVALPDHGLRAALAGDAFAQAGRDAASEAPFFLDRGMEHLPQGILAAYVRRGQWDAAEALLGALLTVETPIGGAMLTAPLIACRALVGAADGADIPLPAGLWRPPVDALIRQWRPALPLAVWQAGALALGGLTQCAGALGEELRTLMMGLLKTLREAAHRAPPGAPERVYRWRLIQWVSRGLLPGVARQGGLLEDLEGIVADPPAFGRILCDGILLDGALAPELLDWILAAEGQSPALVPRLRMAEAHLRVGLGRGEDPEGGGIHPRLLKALAEGEGPLWDPARGDLPPSILGRLGALPPARGAEVALRLMDSGHDLEAPEDAPPWIACALGGDLQSLQAGLRGAEARIAAEAFEEAEGIIVALAGRAARGGASPLAQAWMDGGRGEAGLMALEEGARRRWEAGDQDPWWRQEGVDGRGALRRFLLMAGPLPEGMEPLRAQTLAWLAEGDPDALEPLFALLEAPEYEGERALLLPVLGAAQVPDARGMAPILRALAQEDPTRWGPGADAVARLARGWDPDPRLLEGWPQLSRVLLSLAEVADGETSEACARALWRIARQRV